MTKWIPILLLVLSLPLQGAQAKEDRKSSSSSRSESSRSESSRSERSESSRSDHDDARDALRKGRIMPLTAILDIAAKREPGTVMEVELETERRLVYRIELLTADGRRRELRLDARNGEILSAEDD